MGLIPLVFFQKIVSRVVGGRNSISKRLDSLLSISGKVSELLAEEALLSLQCCNQNLVLRFSRISNKKRLSVILSKLRGEAGQQQKKSYTTKSQTFGLLRKRTTSKEAAQGIQQNLLANRIFGGKINTSLKEPLKLLLKVSDHWPSPTVYNTIKAKRPPLYYQQLASFHKEPLPSSSFQLHSLALFQKFSILNCKTASIIDFTVTALQTNDRPHAFLIINIAYLLATKRTSIRD